ncbi:ATP-dependent DNA ligase [Microbacterium sp. NPDC089695]|uniref:DUF7882 family protein n=1 Tax=Microbacterium sp. NPDC089695 TaxID=3364198 RepID=UPI003818CB24
MGRLIYEGNQKVEIEDRALTHLQLVITSKLRRGEPFAFSWKDDMSTGGGRSTVWINAHSALAFKYHGSRQPELNRAWIEALTQTANTPSGLYLVPEPAPHRDGDTTRKGSSS